MTYVDGFVIPVPKKQLAAYRKGCRGQGRQDLEGVGALDYKRVRRRRPEGQVGRGLFSSKLAKAKAGETVVFSWITYKSKAQRDRINAKVMKDPRLKIWHGATSAFDMKRMTYGGFKVFVDA